MSADEPGLRKRLDRESRRISSQHRQLDVLLQAVATALECEDRPAARAHFVRVADALDAHFAIEEELTFPAVHGLRPALGPTLASLASEHDVLRERTQGVADALQRDGHSGGELLVSLDSLVESLRAHEDREEALLQAIRGGGGAS
jgi:hemerythrin-like domain-containing protein